jgi:alkaline phosphatase
MQNDFYKKNKQKTKTTTTAAAAAAAEECIHKSYQEPIGVKINVNNWDQKQPHLRSA